MIRRGRLCSLCTRTECKSKGTPDSPIEIECGSCDGQGCDSCQDGFVSIDGCPGEMCSDVAMAVRLAGLFEKGIPPVLGGSLDQSAWFLDAVSVFKNEEAALRAEDYDD
ncbi:hypothetical protein VN12_19535 [Pirellula sp. SH-Sr6A]|nr:hypothetical protein VN12_19535 [Pirellula sp. SH-Sr6A]